MNGASGNGCFYKNIFAVLVLFLCVSVVFPVEAQEDVEYNKLPVKIVLFPFRRAVISSNVESRIEKYYFRVGEIFSKGGLLAKLDDSDYRQALLKGEASVREATASSQYADSNLKRKEELFKKGALGFQELEQSKLEKETAYSKRQFASANLELAKINLSSCVIKAPFPGRITKKLRKEYEHVKTGEPVLELIEDNRLLAIVHFSSKKRSKIKEGMSLKFRIDETGTEHVGRVHEISGDIDSGSRTFQVKVLIGNQKRELSAGMSGIYIEDGNDK